MSFADIVSMVGTVSRITSGIGNVSGYVANAHDALQHVGAIKDTVQGAISRYRQAPQRSDGVRERKIPIIVYDYDRA